MLPGSFTGVLVFLFVQQPPLASSCQVLFEEAQHIASTCKERYDICWHFIAYIRILPHAAYRRGHYPALFGPISYLWGTQALSLLTDLTITSSAGRICEVSLQASHKGGSHEDEACSALLRWLSTCSVAAVQHHSLPNNTRHAIPAN